MKILRQLIYLDEYKMYSLSSQLFEGLTEWLVKHEQAAQAEEERQKGEYWSGNLWSHCSTNVQGQQERRILHDHAYALFETELEKQDAIIRCDSSSPSELIARILPGSFVRVEGWSDFNDMKVICETIEKFNEYGQSITYVTTHNQRIAAAQGTEVELKKHKDKNAQAKIKAARKAATDVERLAEKAGLRLDEGLLKHTGHLLNYGYRGHFEVQIFPFGNQPAQSFFSAVLKRECLREEEMLITKKFSRQASGKFCLVGIVCQCPGEPERPKIERSEPQQLREALGVMVSAVCEVERLFFGRLENEFVVDPIALYREIGIQASEEKDRVV